MGSKFKMSCDIQKRTGLNIEGGTEGGRVGERGKDGERESNNKERGRKCRYGDRQAEKEERLVEMKTLNVILFLCMRKEREREIEIGDGERERERSGGWERGEKG